MTPRLCTVMSAPSFSDRYLFWCPVIERVLLQNLILLLISCYCIPQYSHHLGMIHFFFHKNALFPHNRFSTHFFPVKMAELGENALVSCIIDFNDIQLCLRQFCLNLNICKVMTIFFKFWPKKIRKTVTTWQILRFKQNGLSQS